jgi:hypothetical protein
MTTTVPYLVAELSSKDDSLGKWKVFYQAVCVQEDELRSPN